MKTKCLTVQRVKGVRHSRRLMKKSRPSGYTDDEIKIYWCIEQVEALCARKEAFPYEIEHEPADAKVVLNLQNNPVENRAYKGEIQYVTKGIQEAVFDVPPDAQIILLNFAVSGKLIRRELSLNCIFFNSR